MTKHSLYTDQHVLVVGAGKSGLAACCLLKSKGCTICLTDDRERNLQNPDDLCWLDEQQIIQEFGGHNRATFLQADLIVVSPGVPLTLEPLHEALQADIPVIGELELAALFFTGKIIAITGTNGKTTVTSMIGECLQNSGQSVFVGGNIGIPFCSHILQEEQADIAVLEVSSFQLDTIQEFYPKVGLILNISPDHLDRYESYKAYADAKMRLFANQKSTDVAIVNGADTDIYQRLELIPSTIISFADDHWCVDVNNKCLTWLRPESAEEIYQLTSLQLQQPNVQNCMAAISGARCMGAGMEAVQEMLCVFAVPLHRLTTVGSWHGIDFINDSKATNIGAVESALTGMNRPVILIAGGRDKGGDYGLLDFEMKRIVKSIILIGEAAAKMQAAFAEVTDIVRASSLEDAVEQAVAQAVAGDVVLLSPACASFDMFAGYSDRGNKFMQYVKRIMEGEEDSSSDDARQQAV